MSQVKHTHAAPTDAQVKFATALAKQHGYKYLSDAEKACFGKCKIGGLGREGMSQLIEWLKSR
jgi:hypothetical protein